MENVIKAIGKIKDLCDALTERGHPDAAILSSLCAVACAAAVEEGFELAKGNTPITSIGAFYEALSAREVGNARALYIKQAEEFIRDGIPFQPAISLAIAKVTVEGFLAEAA